MHFPNLPTDNLYKFLALSGVVVVLVSIFYPISRLGELRQKAIELAAEIKILDLESKRLTVNHSQLEREVAAFEKQLSAAEKEKRPTPGDIDSIEKIHNQLRTRALKLETSNDDLQVKLVKVSAKNDQLVQLVRYVEYFVNVMYGGIVIGVLLAWVGFGLWYVRVQRPQDLLLKQQIENKAT